VPYTVRHTHDKGRGVFTDETIPTGTVIWRHLPGHYFVDDEASLKARLNGLSDSETIDELIHMFGLPEFPGYIIRVTDDGQLINHSPQPGLVMNKDFGSAEIPYNIAANNVREVEEALLNDRFALIALRDMNAGEELTHNYNEGIEDPPYYDALCEHYNVTWPFL
jgi:SET domain-containing protein